MINEQVEKLQNLFDERSQKYHDDSSYGKNLEAQSKYDLTFKELRT